MSTFKPLLRKNLFTSIAETPVYPSLRPSRSLAPRSIPAPEQAHPDTRAQLEHAVRSRHSFDRLSLFPPEHHAPVLSQDWQPSDYALQQKRPVQEVLQASTESIPVQARLIIGPAHNQYEQVSDQMAERVMRMKVAQADEHVLQRAKQPVEEELKLREEPEIQRVPADAGFEAGPDFESRIVASKSSGSPLPDSVRAFMEPALGQTSAGYSYTRTASRHS